MKIVIITTIVNDSNSMCYIKINDKFYWKKEC